MLRSNMMDHAPLMNYGKAQAFVLVRWAGYNLPVFLACAQSSISGRQRSSFTSKILLSILVVSMNGWKLLACRSGCATGDLHMAGLESKDLAEKKAKPGTARVGVARAR